MITRSAINPLGRVRSKRRPCAKCSRPEDFDDMIACDACNFWYHQSCGGVSQAVLLRSTDSWRCEECVRHNIPVRERTHAIQRSPPTLPPPLTIPAAFTGTTVDTSASITVPAVVETIQQRENLTISRKLVDVPTPNFAATEVTQSAQQIIPPNERIQPTLSTPKGTEEAVNVREFGNLTIHGVQPLAAQSIVGQRPTPDIASSFGDDDSELEDIEAELSLIRKRRELRAKRRECSKGITPKNNLSTASNTINDAVISQRQQQDHINRQQSTPISQPVAGSHQTPSRLAYNPQPKTTGVNFILPTTSLMENERMNTSTGQISAQQLMNRHVIPRDLPKFSGKSTEWPLFYNSFIQTTELCGFTNVDNLMRLQKALTGDARATVEARLCLPDSVPRIMSDLELVYGQVQYIIDDQLRELRKTPSPRSDQLNTIVVFALAVGKLCSTLEAAQMIRHFTNPLLLRELIDKLPPSMKLEWVNHTRGTLEPDVRQFEAWISSIARDICKIHRVNLSSGSKPDTRPKKGDKHDHLVGQHHEEDQSESDSDASSKAEVKPDKCKSCNSEAHLHIFECKKFLSLSVQQRWELVRKIKVCRCCLKHHRPYCNLRKMQCGVENCQEPHHHLLHRTPDDKKIQLQATHQHRSSTVLCRVVPVIVHGAKTSVRTYAFLDGGSTVTMIEESLVKQLGIEGKPKPLHLKWTGGLTRIEDTSKTVVLTIQGQYKNAPTHAMMAHTVSSLELPAHSLNVAELKQDCKYLEGLPLRSYEGAKPTILVGEDNWWLANPKRSREGRQDQPIASKCRLGWAVEGSWAKGETPTDSDTHSSQVHVCECSRTENEELHQLVKSQYEFDALPNAYGSDPYSMDDKKSLEILKQTVTKRGSKYEAGLLWRFKEFSLPDSRPMAEKRLKCLERKLKNNPDLANTMHNQIEDYVRKGYARRLTEDEIRNPPSKVWYLPIFPVLNPKKPNKVRMVWDAAAKVQNTCLNSFLMKGPDLTRCLPSILLRFRQKKVGICGDISEMFHQVRVRKEDIHVQRFLWQNPVTKAVEEYVLQVLSFGATCSPCIAQYVSNVNADNFMELDSEAVESIQQDTYIDDQLKSVDTPERAVEIAQNITFIHSQAGYLMRNWRSNHHQVQEALDLNKENGKKRGNEPINKRGNEPTNKRGNEPTHKKEANEPTADIDLSGGNQVEKVLGMFWQTTTDSFIFSLRYNRGNEDTLKGVKRATKREVLRIQMSIYDPLGLINNLMIEIKLLMQHLWRTGSDWDAELNDEQNEVFQLWLQHLQQIESLAIPRCYLSTVSTWDQVDTQLHVFVDAGKNAYATALYLRMESSSSVDCNLIWSKSRVAPIKMTSIPRLELEAARLGARQTKVVEEALQVTISHTTYWTDSKTVLAWLRSDARANPIFVAHRVGNIQDLTDITDWRYVPSSKNVADEATKSKKKYEMRADSTWLKGPPFLYQQKERWPQPIPLPTLEGVLVNLHHEASPLPVAVEEFDDWNELLRSIVVARRSDNSSDVITSAELQSAQNEVLRNAQQESYIEEIRALSRGKQVSHKSRIASMNPFIDDEWILRGHSRLDLCAALDVDLRQPIILDPKHSTAVLLAKSYHEKANHINHETAINEMRQRYWIPKLRQLMLKIRKSCHTCKFRTTKPKPPQMAPVPPGRASIERPFRHTGVDVFGPIYVVVGRRREPRYGLIFTCLTCRAVDIQVLHSLSTDSFIMAFQIFTATRGWPKVVYSDNGTNFVGAERQLRQEVKALDKTRIAEFFVSPELEWRFNPPLSPHMGGLWERMVRSAKTALYAMVPQERLMNDEILRSTLAVVANTINSRPLTYLPTDVNGEALTPNHLLLLSGNIIQPLGPLSDDPKVLINSWKRSQQLADHFWKRWLTEYAPTMRDRSKWRLPTEPLQIGDTVIIVDPDLPRSSWPIGKIVEIYPGADGQVRSATVQTPAGLYKRPVVKLAQVDKDTTLDYKDQRFKDKLAAGSSVAPGGV